MAKKSAKQKTVLPDPLPKGEVLIDLAKNEWVLGPSIGVGGFGEIYSAAAGKGSKKDYQYVVKIEPHGNGPLFCEMHFFMRNSKPDMLQSWCTQKKISSLGMPRYLGSGSHEHARKKYRFLVMDKYGKDLWHVFLENNRKFPNATVYRIAIQLLDVLEYIHNNGYIHADIKGANILTGLTKSSESQVFLVDYGLASHYTKKDFKPDPKKAHNGTIEYTSRDAHEGIPTRRGDLEILAYNMIQWMGCILPWETDLTNPVLVHKSKKEYMFDIIGFTKICFGTYNPVPAALIEFLGYIKKMEYNTEPDYAYIRKLFEGGLESSDGRKTGPLQFNDTKHKLDEQPKGATPKKRAKPSPKKHAKRKPKDDDHLLPEEEEQQQLYPIAENNERLVKQPSKQIPKSTASKTATTNGIIQDHVQSLPRGYNAEMQRIQKQLTDRKTSKKVPKASAKSKTAMPVVEADDVIDDTPPKKSRLLKRNKEIKDEQLRSLRPRKQCTYTNGDSE